MRLKGIAVVLCSVCLLAAAASAQKAQPSRYAKGGKPAGAGIPSPVDIDADSHFRRLLANTEARVYSVTIAPGESTMLDRHPHDYLVISIGKNSFDAAGDTNRFPLDMMDGEAQILTGGWPHRLVNRASTPATLVVVEIPAGIFPQQSVCGLAARPCGQIRFGNTDEGRYSQSTLFETRTIRLLRVELGPGGVLPDHRDTANHLIVQLARARLQGIEESDSDVSWSSGGLGTIRNVDTKDAKMLIVEIK